MQRRSSVKDQTLVVPKVGNPDAGVHAELHDTPLSGHLGDQDSESSHGVVLVAHCAQGCQTLCADMSQLPKVKEH